MSQMMIRNPLHARLVFYNEEFGHEFKRSLFVNRGVVRDSLGDGILNANDDVWRRRGGYREKLGSSIIGSNHQGISVHNGSKLYLK
jgi:hypothetical protein